jgi:hypothetical protein
MVKSNTMRTIFIALLGVVVILPLCINQATAEKDQREVVYLDDENRAFVIQEMQLFVSGLQQTITALSNGDMKSVAVALRSLGMQSMSTAPATLMSNLPMEFRQIGMPIHMAFDKLATAADQGATPEEILAGLGTAMNRCIACHAAYRIEPSSP